MPTTPEPATASEPAGAADDLEVFRADLDRHIAAGTALLTSGILDLQPRPYSPELADFHRSRESLRLRIPGITEGLARELAYTALPVDTAIRAISACLDADLFGSSVRLYRDFGDLALSYLDEGIRWRHRRRRFTGALEGQGLVGRLVRRLRGR
jgi:hypothetical protein